MAIGADTVEGVVSGAAAALEVVVSEEGVDGEFIRTCLLMLARRLFRSGYPVAY